MKPGPAISTASTSGCSAILAETIWATWRGFMPACFAQRSATLVAQSP